ncbi:MAG: thermopsin family protease [Nanopusillaceae archaeon]
MDLFGLSLSVSLPAIYPFSIAQTCVINGYGCYDSFVQNFKPDPSNPNLIYMPIGISDYGIAIKNGEAYQYSYITNEIIGFVYLDYLHVRPGNKCNKEKYYDASSIQLNGVLLINADDGKTYYLWVQNTVDINNDNNYYRLVNNIWEIDKYQTIAKSKLLSGKGSMYGYPPLLSYTYVYIYYTNKYSLAYPFVIYLITNVTMSGNYPVIQFGYSTDGNNIIWYDNVTIQVPSKSAYFQVAPQLTPVESPQNLELVIGGLSGEDCVYVTQVSGYLTLLYNNNGILTPVPYVFNYGLSTAETSTNINPLPVSSTSVYLNTDNFRPDYLGNVPYKPFTVTIYDPITKRYHIEQYPVVLYKIYTFQPKIYVPGGYYYLKGIYVNNVSYPGPVIPLLINKSYTINPDYTLYYYVDLILPNGTYYIDGKQYQGRNTFTVENGTTIIVYLNRYYYYDAIRYECPYLVYVPVYSPGTVQLLNYCVPEYQVNFTIPAGVYYVDGQKYIGKGTIYAKNGTTLSISLEKYYYYNDLRYECPNQIYITTYGSREIQLLNYCTPEYYVKIDSQIPINITIGNTTITNIKSYSDYLPADQKIYINKSVLVEDHFFYYDIYTIDPKNITINKSIQIYLHSTMTREFNYITITSTIFTISALVLIPLILIKKRRKSSE